jgi:hypothetical protein
MKFCAQLKKTACGVFAMFRFQAFDPLSLVVMGFGIVLAATLSLVF